MDVCTQEQRIDNLEERMDKQECLTTDIRLILAKQSGTQVAIVAIVGFISTIGGFVLQLIKG